MSLESGFKEAHEGPSTVFKTADEITSKDFVWENGAWKQVIGVVPNPGGTGSRILIKDSMPRLLDEPEDKLEVKNDR